MSTSLVHHLYRRWDRSKETLQLIDHAQQITWNVESLQDSIERMAAYLNEWGLERGDIIALQAPKSLEWIAFFLASLSQGITVLLLNPSYASAEIIYYLQQSQAKRAILTSDVLERLSHTTEFTQQVRQAHFVDDQMLKVASQHLHKKKANTEVSAQDIAVLAYTSGTTGKPKGAQIRHADMIGTLVNLHQAWAWDTQDCIIHTLPIFHIHGLFVAALASLWAGARCVFLNEFNAQEALRCVDEYRATILMGVPTHHHRYLQLTSGHVSSLSSLRLVTSGSAPLLATQHQAFEEKFGIQITERYGMTEIGIVISNPIDGIKKAGSIGVPLPNVKVKIIRENSQNINDILPIGEVGELHIHSPSIFAGYLNLPHATQEALYGSDDERWMRTGDLGYCDSDGYYFLVGRRSDMIISGGLNVYPVEIENQINACLDEMVPWVEELAVIGIEHAEWGEKVVAALIVNTHWENIDQYVKQLALHLRTCVAAYKCPKEYRVFQTFPRNAMGKLQKNKLRALWDDGITISH